MTEIPAVIRAEGVNKVFTVKNADPVIALKDIHLDVKRGEFVSLIGPSGCGKSTLLRLIADLLQPTSGEMVINGKTPVQARLDRDYGMVFQAATLYDWRNVGKNVQLPLEIMGIDKAEREKRAAEMLELVELGKFAKHYPWQLSGGMQQRVAIARALINEPAILLADEPTGNLDTKTGAEVLELLRRGVDEHGWTVVMVTHDPAAALVAERIVFLRDGHVAGETRTKDTGARQVIDTFLAS